LKILYQLHDFDIQWVDSSTYEYKPTKFPPKI
jgi:hypothetical protein